jgi:EAL domain-containing protein (putative c-di-GMP-specific phosphodiesterase class I)
MAREDKWADIHAGQDGPLNAAASSRDREVLDMVDRAIRHRQVTLAYQPVVTAAETDRIAFYEGLARVLDPNGHVIPAREFITEVENRETGRLIDCLALEMGLATLAAQPGLRLSINMSARSIGYERWMRTLDSGLAADPTVAERLILEITESSAMLVPEIVVNFMANLQDRGIAFALDDFGAGHTSFRFLKKFLFDFIKIDGQFVRGISTDADNQVLTAALLSIGRQFDMVTVAESVESPDDAAYLTTLGVDCLQGYHFGAPTVRPPWAAPGRSQASA